MESCFQYGATEQGTIGPRPLGHTLHESKPNEVIHIDYCFLKKGEGGKLYVLIVKDDLSGYFWLRATSKTDTATTAAILLHWIPAFGIPSYWISDKGSHSKYQIVKHISDTLYCAHHFTMPHCSWRNCSVEMLCQELLRVKKACYFPSSNVTRPPGDLLSLRYSPV